MLLLLLIVVLYCNGSLHTDLVETTVTLYLSICDTSDPLRSYTMYMYMQVTLYLSICTYAQVTPYLSSINSNNQLVTGTVCQVKAQPHPPGTTDSASITVKEVTIESSSLSVNVEWTEIEESYGEIANYQVRLLSHMVLPSDVVDESMVVAETSESMVSLDHKASQILKEFSVILSFDLVQSVTSGETITWNNLRLEESSHCLYLQVTTAVHHNE